MGRDHRPRRRRLRAQGRRAAGARQPSAPSAIDRLAALLPAALLAALVVVSTFDGGRRLVLDARLIGVLAAAIALWRRATFIVVVLVAAAATALVRLL